MRLNAWITPVAGGDGLGMRLVEGLARQVGARLEMQSEAGAAFDLTLPGRREMPVSATPCGRPAPRILIVEDEFLIAMALEDMLLAMRYAVVGIAANYETAVALAAEKKPALVLMDIRLVSERDGIDAATEIHRTFSVPSLFTSTNIDPENMDRAKAASPVGWVPKIYSPEVINEAVAEALSQTGQP